MSDSNTYGASRGDMSVASLEHLNQFQRNTLDLLNTKKSNKIMQKMRLNTKIKVSSFPQCPFDTPKEFKQTLRYAWFKDMYASALEEGGFSKHMCLTLLSQTLEPQVLLPDALSLKKEDIDLAVRLCLASRFDLVYDDLPTAPISELLDILDRGTVICMATLIACMCKLGSISRWLGVDEVTVEDDSDSSKHEEIMVQALTEELNNYREKISSCQDEISSLKEELAQSKAGLEAAKHREVSLTKQVEELSSRLYNQQKSEISAVKALQVENDSLQLQVESLKRLVAALANPDEDSILELDTPIELEPEADSDVLTTNWTEVLPKRGIAFVGCHDNLSFKIQELFPEWKIINYGDHGFTLSTSTKVMVLHTGYMTHGQYYRAMSKFSGDTIYVSGTNLDRMFSHIKTELDRLKI